MEPGTMRNDGRTVQEPPANRLADRTVECHRCCARISTAMAVSIDVSAPDEHCRDYQHFCPEHSPLVSEMV